MSILCIGSVALDSVETPFGQREEVLGGSATHFSCAASFFSKLQMVAVVGEDFPKEHIDFLQGQGIDLKGLEVAPGKTFRWQGRYGFDLNNAETLETQLNVFADFVPKVPEEWSRPDCLFLGNIHPSLQLEVLRSIERPRLVALDTMNFWIEGEGTSLRKTIEQVDLVVINEAECRQLVGEASLLKAARAIQAWGPKIVIAKQGEYGALLFHGNEIFSAPGFPLEQVLDPTGAGDSFAGGLLGYLARCKEPSFQDYKQAVIMGSVMASFNVEDFSCDRMRHLDGRQIQARYDDFRRLAHFDPIATEFLSDALTGGA